MNIGDLDKRQKSITNVVSIADILSKK